MKSILISLLLVFNLVSSEFVTEETNDFSAPTNFILLDRIEAVVAESDHVGVITSLDVARRGYDGRKYSVQDLVDENLLDSLADKFKMNVDDKDITRYLQKINMSDVQVRQLAQNNGYSSLSELYEQFRKMFRANSALGFKTQSELVFSEDTIFRYYKDNPQYTEAKMIIQTSYISVDDYEKKEKIRSDLEKYIKGVPTDVIIVWNDPVTILRNEIADSSKFLFGMKEGEIFIKDMPQGFMLFKLCKDYPACEVPLEARKSEIIEILKNEKYAQVIEKVMEGLRKSSLILLPTFEMYPIDTPL